MPSWPAFLPALARLLAGVAALLLLLGSGAGRTELAPLDARDRIHPVYARHGLVVAQEALASQVGLTVLQQGGHGVPSPLDDL